jgi:hypothetical protein
MRGKEGDGVRSRVPSRRCFARTGEGGGRGGRRGAAAEGVVSEEGVFRLVASRFGSRHLCRSRMRLLLLRQAGPTESNPFRASGCVGRAQSVRVPKIGPK